MNWYQVTLPKLPDGVVQLLKRGGIDVYPPDLPIQTALQKRFGIVLDAHKSQPTVVAFVDPATCEPLGADRDGTLAEPPEGGPPLPHPADLAGVRIGSVIHAIAGTRVDSVAEAERAMSRAPRVIAIEFTDPIKGTVQERHGVEIFEPPPRS